VHPPTHRLLELESGAGDEEMVGRAGEEEEEEEEMARL